MKVGKLMAYGSDSANEQDGGAFKLLTCISLNCLVLRQGILNWCGQEVNGELDVELLNIPRASANQLSG